MVIQSRLAVWHKGELKSLDHERRYREVFLPAQQEDLFMPAYDTAFDDTGVKQDEAELTLDDIEAALMQETSGFNIIFQFMATAFFADL